MPLFFFISGYFAYKPLDAWTIDCYRKQVPQKIKALLFCTLVFYTFRYYSLGADPFGWLKHGFMGYWFTIDLLDMFVIYFVVTALCRLMGKDLVLPSMIVFAILGNVLIPTGIFHDWQFGTIIGVTNLCFFIQWFVLGLVFKRFNSRFEYILSGSSMKAVLIVAYVIGMCVLEEGVLSGFGRKIFGSIVIPYIAVLLIVSLFFYFRDFFYSSGRIAKFMCFTGQRSLDVYMLHYFFLPSLPVLGSFLAPNSMIIFQLLIGAGMACVITGVCLIISSCLRSSNFISDWLFGVRRGL